MENKKDIENYVSVNQKEDWIIGLPLKTKYGYIRQIKIKEKSRTSSEVEFLKLESWQVTSKILSHLKGSVIEDDTKKVFENSSFMVCVKNNFQKLRDTYKKVLDTFFIDGFDEDLFFTMSQSEFDDLRILILDLNSVSYRIANPNKEIDKFDRIKQKIAERQGRIITFDTMFSTLMTKEGGGHLPEEILGFTMRQFVQAFKRVEFIKRNEATTLFKTVDTNNQIEIVDWFKSTEEVEEKQKTYKSIDDIKKSNAFIK